MDVQKLLGSIAALILFALSGATAVRAQDAITVTLTPERTELTVGDVAPLTLRVTHPAGYRVVGTALDGLPPMMLDAPAESAAPPQQWGELEIRNRTAPAVTVNSDGSETTTLAFEGTLWAPGAYSTPALPISVVDTDGRVFNVLADPVSLTVDSVLVDGDTQLREIKPQAAFPPPPLWRQIAGWALAVVAVTLVLWLLLRWLYGVWRLRPGRDLRPAHQVALDELARVEALDLPGQNRAQEHYTLISHALRRYLEEAYRVPALDRCTSEIHAALHETPIAPAIQQRVMNLLVDADLVKFANLTPESTQAAQSVQDARQLVLALKPETDATTSKNPTRRIEEATA